MAGQARKQDIPPIAPAIFGPKNFAIIRIIAVAIAEAKLFNAMSIKDFLYRAW